MGTAWEGPRVFRFSTNALPEPARARAVRTLHADPRLQTRLEPLVPLPNHLVRVDIVQQALPALGIMSGMLCGLRQHIEPECSVRAGNDHLFLGVNLTGVSLARQGGREITLGSGDALFANRGNAGCTISRPTPVRFVGLRLYRSPLAPLVAYLDDAELRLIAHHSEVLQLLTRYVHSLVNGHPPSTPALQQVVATQLYDLVALAIGPTRDAALVAQDRGVRAARLGSIKMDIVANLRDGNLSVGAIAERHRVTPRYVHKLFESEEMTFSEFVLERRLEHARRMLADPRFRGRTISSIAFDIGFGDLSYFNRTFRRRYDATPSEVRHSSGSGLPIPLPGVDADRSR